MAERTAVILVVDKNSTWLEKRPVAVEAAARRGWRIVAIGEQSSGLHRETPDDVIYRTATEKGWRVVTRDRDFIDIAQSAMAKSETMTDVYLAWDVVVDAEQLYRAIEKAIRDGHAGEAAAARVTNIELYLASDYRAFCEAKRAVIRAEGTRRQPPAAALQVIADYVARGAGNGRGGAKATPVKGSGSGAPPLANRCRRGNACVGPNPPTRTRGGRALCSHCEKGGYI